MRHFGPSTIGIDTLYRSEGHIPEVFLREAGVLDHFLIYLPSLFSQPIQYYTCFISYSSHNEAFAERLRADLQSQSVRCWFAPHDLRPGTWIHEGIDQAIRVYDKLVLILSEQAIASEWVRFEVNMALQKERERKADVLFPLRIDRAILTCQEGWAQSLRARHIGDFEHWKQHDAYQQAFTLLLHHLQTSSHT